MSEGPAQTGPSRLLKGYQAMQKDTTPMPEAPRRYGFRKSLEAVKEGVPIQVYVATLTDLERFGGNGWLTGRCPLPNHEDREPSFYVYGDGRAHCYGCGFHGDIFDLFRAVEGGELWEAMISLAQRYDIGLPKRPDRWHRWHSEKYRRLNAMRDVVAESYRRQFFRMHRDHLATIKNPDEREEEAHAIWRDLWSLARSCAEWRISKKGGAV